LGIFIADNEMKKTLDYSMFSEIYGVVTNNEDTADTKEIVIIMNEVNTNC
jgi:hypothetical protein